MGSSRKQILDPSREIHFQTTSVSVAHATQCAYAIPRVGRSHGHFPDVFELHLLTPGRFNLKAEPKLPKPKVLKQAFDRNAWKFNRESLLHSLKVSGCRV